jgi:hypothetical protein
MLADASFSLAQSLGHIDHTFVWSARLRDGTVVHEQPGVSSDALPRDDVVGVTYHPRVQGFPRIDCPVDLDAGERFVRYWTTIWQSKRASQRLYVAGVERAGRVALVAYYARANKAIFAATRPFQPPWQPKPFHCLPSGAVLTGGAGTPAMGWRHQGFGGELRIEKGGLVFRAVY